MTRGLVLELSIQDNLILGYQNLFQTKGVFDRRRIREFTEGLLKEYGIKAPNTSVKCSALSGGNQQKVVIAKCLATKPDILILDEPTRGIDVGSKAEIYEIMSDLVEQGVSIIMISSELPELLNMSDRIIVMREGSITGELTKEEASEERVMKFATKEM